MQSIHPATLHRAHAIAAAGCCRREQATARAEALGVLVPLGTALDLNLS